MIPLEVGSSFAKRYRVVRRIASGGMGTVYEVVHNETSRHLALKVMHAHIVESAEHRERFKLEARVAAQVGSDHIVDVQDAGVDEATDLPFLVMELLRGEELATLLARSGRLAPAEAMTYLWQIALALKKSHAANIVHRDLKPENIFLSKREDGSTCVKVLDFGVAKLVAESGDSAKATRSLGTPLYMAPEQFRGRTVSSATDNFALAMMAFTLIVGRAYWAAEASEITDAVAFALKAHMGPAKLASERATREGVPLPDGFDAWFSRATAKDPDARFASATSMIAALASVFGISLGPAASEANDVVRVATPATAPEPATMAASTAGTTQKTEPAPSRRAPTALVVLATLGVLGIVGSVGTLGYLVLSDEGAHDTAPPPTTPTTEASAPQPSPSVSVVVVQVSVPVPPELPSASASAAKPVPRPVSWRKRGVACVVDETTKRCSQCCYDGDTLGPPPACECLFDGEKWDREHHR